MSQLTPEPVENSIASHEEELRKLGQTYGAALFGLDPELYRAAKVRCASDPEYAEALGAHWEDTPKEVLESLDALILGCEQWPVLRDAFAALPITDRVTFPAALEHDTPVVTFRCPRCRKTISGREAGFKPHGASLNFSFDHDDDSPECPFGVDGGFTDLLEWLGLGAFAADAAFDLSFLDGGEEGGQGAGPDWLIPGMFARGDYWSLFGPSEVGKSLLALDWSLQMARRGERVLYLDRENSREVLQARLRKMGARREDFTNLLLKPLGTDGLKDLATEAGATGLHELVSKNKITVVVLDTISKFSESGQATQSDRWQKMYNHSFVPLLSRGVSIGQLDHTGLSDKTRERDSSAKRDNVSIAWALSWRGKDKLNANRAKNRPGYASPGALAIDRVDEPLLTHVMREAVPDEIRRALAELDRLGVPQDAGRTVARDRLKQANHPMSDALLNRALKARKES